MKQVLVTGGAGFIGLHLCRALVERGARVVVLDSLLPQVHGGVRPSLPAGCELIEASVTDRAALSRAVTGCDLVYHLAAETGTGQSMTEPARYVHTNVGGTATLLEVLQQASGRPRVVLAASRAVYGEGASFCATCPSETVYPPVRSLAQLEEGNWEPRCPACGGPLTPAPTPETAPVAPSSVYGVTKLAQEDLLRVAAEAGMFEAWALRFQNVYGPGQALGNPYTGLLAVFTNRLRQGLPCLVFEDGRCARDFVHVADVVRALIEAGARRPEGYRCLNVGSGRPTTILEVAELVTNLARRELARPIADPIVTGAFRAGDIRSAHAAIDEARQVLDWQPEVPLERGLESYWSWAGAQAVAEDLSAAAQGELTARGLGSAGEERPA